ncbi:MAG: sulfatase [bacterium]|nr:sulfatase [bacterium]
MAYNQNSKYERAAFLSRIITLIFILTIIQLSCTPVEPPLPPHPPPADSLLFHTPLIGDESDIRIPSPVPERFVADELSVDGWSCPPEKILRFPVDLRENPHLSFLFHCFTTIPIRIGDLIFKIDYIPSEYPPESGELPTEPIVLFDTTPIEFPTCFETWVHQDLDLSSHAPGRGELRFIIDGPLAGDPGLNFIWGEPVIYYPSEMKNKNVLIIGVDTLRRDALSVYGASPLITPNLETFVEKATTFNQARSQAPWTLPSFASMITGRLPSEINAMSYTGHLPGEADTIGEILLKNGFATSTICSNPWLGYPQSGFHQGMEELWYRYDATAGAEVDKALDFIDRTNGRDWFCFLHFMDPHTPYHPREQFRDLLFDPFLEGSYSTYFDDVEPWKSGEYIPTDSELQQVKNLYLGEVAYVDAMLAQLYKGLEDRGLLDNTLIIFAADHGEEFFDHGGFEHGHTQYDELVHMPLIIMGEGFPAGGVIDTSVGNTDIFPSILKYLDLDIPDNLHGLPLQNVINDNIDNSRPIFGEDNTRWSQRKFVVEWPYKCILDFVSFEAKLFNLADDPGELTDISADNTDITMHLEADIIANMHPSLSAFYIWVTRSLESDSKLYTGTITLPDGIDSVEALEFAEGDTWSLDGNVLTFSISSSQTFLGPVKHIVITPSEGSETLVASIQVQGGNISDLFFPYGDRTPAESGDVTVHLSDYPFGFNLPYSADQDFEGFYIWGTKQFDISGNGVELNEETRAQLRSLGYLD